MAQRAVISSPSSTHPGLWQLGKEPLPEKSPLPTRPPPKQFACRTLLPGRVRYPDWRHSAALSEIYPVTHTNRRFLRLRVTRQ